MNKEVNINKKRNAIIFSILTLMVCIIGGTYAYFALTASNNSVTGSVGGASLELSVNKLFPSSDHDEKNMIPQLYATLDEAISDKHSCIDGNGNVICQVYQATVTNLGSTSSVLKGTITFEGLDADEDGVSDIPNLKWMRINDSRTLGTYDSYTATLEEAIFEENKTFAANQTETYYFVIWIDETGEIQEDIGDFRAVIEFDSITGGLTSTVRPLLTTYIDELYNDGTDITSVHIADDSSKQEVHLNPNQGLMKVDQGDTYGEEYRYYGATPNNYVRYNNELWRIISSSKVFSSESDTTGEQRIRLIKDTSIGNYATDTDSTPTNNWVDATLMCQLNTMYYNDTITMCSNKTLTSLNDSLNTEAKSLIDNALWYLGGATNDTYRGLYADDFYNMEKNNPAYGTDPTRWIGKVGLIYPSDYAYAADLSVCKKPGFYMVDEDYRVELCKGTDWLYVNNGDQRAISPYSSWDGAAFAIYNDGSVSGVTSLVTTTLIVRPVVVLNSNVRVMGGDGSIDRPYTLGVRKSS